MEVVCFCGTAWFSDDDLARCPECDEPAAVPNVSDADLHDMETELALIFNSSPSRDG